jgi:hypothetical protein
MIDRKTIRSLLENMERAAEETLQQDAAFFEALQALKWEIDSDARVQLAVAALQAAGRRVFNSFVPQIKIRVKTEQGTFALPKAAMMPAAPAGEQVDKLIEELKAAASAVIMNSRHRHELDIIVNEAVGANDRFEGMASQIENAGHELVICLDLSAYAQVRASTAPSLPFEGTVKSVSHDQPFNPQFSAHDLTFLKAVGVKADESPSC